VTTWRWAQLPTGVYGLPGPAVVTSFWVLEARESQPELAVVDPVPGHVAQARDEAEGAFSAALGDARALDAADGSVDVTPLLGPLYRLINPADRAAALTEAVQVTRPGGLVAAAAISRHAALLELTGLGS